MSTATNPADLSATEAARLIAEGTITSRDVTAACLARIAERDPEVRAWSFIDPDYAMEQASAADAWRQEGRPPGRLHGVPVGVKDIFDTRDMPTEYGTPLAAGRRPSEDAAAVAKLRHAGAVIMGKTVTTELAVYSPNETRNPHDTGHTPGGSSSGSAAAVAAGMVPLALGSQTNGSVVRPASYCGVVGYKPSFGLISRRGVLAQSPPLDQIGVFARDVEDAALITDCLTGFDPGDRDSLSGARAPLCEVAGSEPPLTPVLAFVKTPAWEKVAEDVRAGFAELNDVLGDTCDEVDLPDPFTKAYDCHRTIMVADLAKSFASYYDRGKDGLSAMLSGMIKEGRGVLAVDYNLALDWREVLYAGLSEILERYDAIVTPATTGEAPKGLESTGDPIAATLWTFLGVPAITLPLLTGGGGLPVGVQIVAGRGDDARLLRTARWLAQTVAED
jgi:Asp-tRNA(Asn)/Glu-tRNA(Gln) amidotransferase A subunit family amidase